jgi:hypothetical protein
MEDVITHELIHALDHCRGKVNFSDPRHLACTEIRAAGHRFYLGNPPDACILSLCRPHELGKPRASCCQKSKSKRVALFQFLLAHRN